MRSESYTAVTLWLKNGEIDTYTADMSEIGGLFEVVWDEDGVRVSFNGVHHVYPDHAILKYEIDTR